MCMAKIYQLRFFYLKRLSGFDPALRFSNEKSIFSLNLLNVQFSENRKLIFNVT